MKSFKKVLAYALAATLALGSCTTAFAATSSPSKTDKKATKYTSIAATSKSVGRVATTRGGNATVKTVKNNKTVTVPAQVKVRGINYKVTTIDASAFKAAKKATKITINKPAKKITFKKDAFKGSSKKIKTVVLKINKKSQLVAKKGSFKGLSKKAVIKVDKKTKASELKKIQKALKAAGFNGKVKKA